MIVGATLAAALCFVAAAQQRGWTRRAERRVRRAFGSDFPYVAGWLGVVGCAFGVAAAATWWGPWLIAGGALLLVWARHDVDRENRRAAERTARLAAEAAAEDAVAGEVRRLAGQFAGVAARVDQLASDVDVLLDEPYF